MNFNTSSRNFLASNLKLNKVNLTFKPQSLAEDLPPYFKPLLHELDNTNLIIEITEYLSPYSRDP
jgi:hypothetical protein